MWAPHATLEKEQEAARLQAISSRYDLGKLEFAYHKLWEESWARGVLPHSRPSSAGTTDHIMVWEPPTSPKPGKRKRAGAGKGESLASKMTSISAAMAHLNRAFHHLNMVIEEPDSGSNDDDNKKIVAGAEHMEHAGRRSSPQPPSAPTLAALGLPSVPWRPRSTVSSDAGS
ncbi:hypothetical protein SAMD00023353_7900200 [Rosellinia necatrix]|uniref:Uncharacterized protein n=1 Tax=Rosellinia necatrix TaxID=77044 RepID=A0A1W2TUX7_ROSNE|nr:hypothetical protein SAMD00023353_7900200 [Rosellinia necatrix]